VAHRCLALCLLLGVHTGCAAAGSAVHPGEQVGDEDDALSALSWLERRIASGTDTERDRNFAYERVCDIADDASAGYAYARAALAGRAAEGRGLSAIALIKEVQRYGRMSVKRDRAFRDGAARRMLGTLYVFAGDRLDDGDSETGLELLEALVDERPDSAINQLRLGEGYIALGDPDSARVPLCRARALASQLVAWERRLLAGLEEEMGGPSAVSCGGGE